MKRWGDRLGIIGGCGFPKSGTVWLCQLASGYLDLPFPQNPHSPIAMASVVHGHWTFDPRLPKTIYVVRDGRDVLTSLYFHMIRHLGGHRSQRSAKKTRTYFERLFGPSFDPEDATGNMAKFVESELTNPLWGSVGWADHVDGWLTGEPDRVAIVRFERMLQDPVAELGLPLSELVGEPLDTDYLAMTASRFDFERITGRPKGTSDQDSFERKGVAGDWRNYFSAESSSVFDQIAGPTMRRLGYAHATPFDSSTSLVPEQ